MGRLSALPAHVLLETFRVLTAGTAPGVLSPTAVARVLDSLGIPLVQLPPGEYLGLVKIMASAKRPGGAIYDAQIAATAKHNGLKLLSRDRRAVATYDLVGVDYELI